MPSSAFLVSSSSPLSLSLSPPATGFLFALIRIVARLSRYYKKLCGAVAVRSPSNHSQVSTSHTLFGPWMRFSLPTALHGALLFFSGSTRAAFGSCCNIRQLLFWLRLLVGPCLGCGLHSVLWSLVTLFFSRLQTSFPLSTSLDPLNFSGRNYEGTPTRTTHYSCYSSETPLAEDHCFTLSASRYFSNLPALLAQSVLKR